MWKKELFRQGVRRGDRGEQDVLYRHCRAHAQKQPEIGGRIFNIRKAVHDVIRWEKMYMLNFNSRYVSIRSHCPLAPHWRQNGWWPQ
jgi:hypothetical protein